MSAVLLAIYRSPSDQWGRWYVDAVQSHVATSPGTGWSFKGVIGEQEVAMLPEGVADRIWALKEGQGLRTVIDSDEIDRGLGVEVDLGQFGTWQAGDSP